MDLHIYLHQVPPTSDGVTLKSLADQLTALTALTTKRFNMADATLQEIANDVTAETTVEQGIATMVTGLVAAIAALPGITAAQQTAMNSIRDGIVNNTAGFAQALATGTAAIPPPAAGTPPPVVQPT